MEQNCQEVDGLDRFSAHHFPSELGLRLPATLAIMLHHKLSPAVAHV